jgi:hypothetical protein
VAQTQGGAAFDSDETDGNDDEDQMNDMIVDISRGYALESADPPSEVQNFYKLIATSEEKVHNGTNVTILPTVTHL